MRDLEHLVTMAISKVRKSKLTAIFHYMPKGITEFVYGIYIILLYPWHYCFMMGIRKRKNAKKQIVVIGDSHSAFFSGNDSFVTKNMYISRKIGTIQYEKEKDERFCVLRLGPGLAYNTNRYGSNTKTLEKYEWLKNHFFSSGDTLIVAFGEIDIRTRVFKYSSGDGYKKNIDNIVDNYMEFLLKVKNDGFKTVVWGPIPSQKDEWDENDRFPRCGSEIQRNKATEYFNKVLNEKCSDNGIGFMTIFYDIIDWQYRTNGDYIFDECHLNQKARPFLEHQLALEKL